MKQCCRCKRLLPRTSEYFYRKKSLLDGLHYECKECAGYRFKKPHTDKTINLIPIEGHKYCYRCDRYLPYDKFYKSNTGNNKHGIDTYCRECWEKHRRNTADSKKEYSKQYFQNHKEQRYNYIKERLKDPIYRETIRDYKRIYAQNHPEQSRLYYQNNKEQIQIRQKIYNSKNKEKLMAWRREYMRVYTPKRNALKKQLESTLTSSQWEKIKSHFDNKCAYCGKEKQLEMEHFIPLTKLGEFTHNNIIPACKSCNSSKGNKDFSEWYPTYRFYSKKREKKILDYLGYKGEVQQLRLMG